MKFSAASILMVATGSLQLVSAVTWPTAQGSVTLKAPQKVTGTFDCGLKRYGRGLKCSDEDGGEQGAVFILEGGATLKNCIIGSDQKEGVHCKGPCKIENVWWEKVCEDALTVLQTSGTTTVTGGGAKGAIDKVIQHNGKGTVHVKNFDVQNFGKIYRSCGNCSGNSGPRKVILENITASGGSVFAGVNQNYGDTATIKNSCGAKVSGMCQTYNGCDKSIKSCESPKISTGFNGRACIDAGGNKDKC